MNKTHKTIIGTVILATAASQALAGGGLGYRKGLALCTEEAEQLLGRGAVFDRSVLVNETAGHREFFLNAYHWSDGERSRARIACTTSKNGREIVAIEQSEGRFVVHEPQYVADGATAEVAGANTP